MTTNHPPQTHTQILATSSLFAKFSVEALKGVVNSLTKAAGVTQDVLVEVAIHPAGYDGLIDIRLSGNVYFAHAVLTTLFSWMDRDAVEGIISVTTLLV